MNSIRAAWLFDVDGVIANPQSKKVDAQIINEIEKILHKGEPVAIVTGRSINWLRERLFSSLMSKVDAISLDKLFVSGEFGGVSVKFRNGKETEEVDSQLCLPQNVIDKAKIITKDFSETIFFDSTKRTMVSVEMHDGYKNMQGFKEDQKKISAKFKEIIEDAGIEENFEVHDDTIATNIRNKRANKGNSAFQVLEWLKSNNFNPSEFICFGDSVSDLEMGQEIHDKGYKIKFVFVGNKNEIKGINISFPIIQTSKLYENGALEYLKESNLS